MNAIPLTRHLLLKDLRRQRAWVVFVWGAASLLPFAARYRYEAGITSGVFTLAIDGFFVLIFMVLVRLIRLDAPGREFHFLSTRPVSWKALLAGKIIFIALFLLLHVWIAKLGAIYLMKIPVSLTDVVLILAECTISVGALLAAVALLSMYLRSLPAIFACMLALAALIYFGARFLEEHSWHSGVIPGRIDGLLQNSRKLMFYMAGMLTIGVVAIYRYSRKTIRKSLGILAAGGALSLAAWIYWPCDLSRFFPDKAHDAGALPASVRDRIKIDRREVVGLNVFNGKPIHTMGGGDWNGTRYFTLRTPDASVEGIQSPYFATLVDYHAEARLKSGRVIHSSFGDLVNSLHSIGSLPWDLQKEMAGLAPSTPEEHGFYFFEVFSYLPAQYQQEDLTGADITGVQTLEIRRAVIVKIIPLKTGASVDLPRQHYVINNVKFKSDAVDFQLAATSVVSALRGDISGWGGGGNLEWIVFNRAKGEYLVEDHVGPGDRGGGSSFLSEDGAQDLDYRRDAYGDQEKAIPPDWADNAGIIFFSSEPCGRISLPYEIKNVDLQH